MAVDGLYFWVGHSLYHLSLSSCFGALSDVAHSMKLVLRSLGAPGWTGLLQERKENAKWFEERLGTVSSKLGRGLKTREQPLLVQER